MRILKAIKQVFSKPSAESIAQQELEDARRELLQAQTALDYYGSSVQYQQNRINRLRSFVTSNSSH